jgi:hypothetical protein
MAVVTANSDMTINLYKEDGFTMWALLSRFPELLKALGDQTEPHSPEVVIFYRPSFGRQSDSPTGVSKQFGEFDLLIGTPQAVYAVESKPEKCGELDRRTMVLTLRDEQLRRHRIFATYRSLWQKYRPKDWKQFRAVALDEFTTAHPGWTMAEERNELGRNLEFVLRSLERCGERVQDTILLFHRAGRDVAFTHGDGFTCVPMAVDVVARTSFVQWKTAGAGIAL